MSKKEVIHSCINNEACDLPNQIEDYYCCSANWSRKWFASNIGLGFIFVSSFLSEILGIVLSFFFDDTLDSHRYLRHLQDIFWLQVIAIGFTNLHYVYAGWNPIKLFIHWWALGWIEFELFFQIVMALWKKLYTCPTKKILKYFWFSPISCPSAMALNVLNWGSTYVTLHGWVQS